MIYIHIVLKDDLLICQKHESLRAIMLHYII